MVCIGADATVGVTVVAASPVCIGTLCAEATAAILTERLFFVDCLILFLYLLGVVGKHLNKLVLYF